MSLPQTHRSHASVFGRLVEHELRIVVLPESTAAQWDVPLDMVPVGSRAPNSLLWVTWDQDSGSILNVETRSADDPSPMY